MGVAMVDDLPGSGFAALALLGILIALVPPVTSAPHVAQTGHDEDPARNLQSFQQLQDRIQLKLDAVCGCKPAGQGTLCVDKCCCFTKAQEKANMYSDGDKLAVAVTETDKDAPYVIEEKAAARKGGKASPGNTKKHRKKGKMGMVGTPPGTPA